MLRGGEEIARCKSVGRCIKRGSSPKLGHKTSSIGFPFLDLGKMMSFKVVRLAGVVVIATSVGVLAKDNGLAITPQMGCEFPSLPSSQSKRIGEKILIEL